MLKRTPDTGRGLPLHVLDYLLDVRRDVQEIEALQAAGVAYDAFYEFDEMPDAERRWLWQTHGVALRRAAQRRGIALPDSRKDDGGPAAA